MIFKTKGYYHGFRKMVEARSGLPEKGPTLTLKKEVLEWEFWKTCFFIKVDNLNLQQLLFAEFFDWTVKKSQKVSKTTQLGCF